MSGDEACFESIMFKRSMSDRNAEILESRGEGKATCGGRDNLGLFENAPRLGVGMANGTREQAMSIEMVATGAGEVLAMRLCCGIC
jgi:hypothetical protein